MINFAKRKGHLGFFGYFLSQKCFYSNRNQTNVTEDLTKYSDLEQTLLNLASSINSPMSLSKSILILIKLSNTLFTPDSFMKLAREENPDVPNQAIYLATTRLQTQELLPSIIQSANQGIAKNLKETTKVSESNNKPPKKQMASDIKQKIKKMYARNLLTSVNTEEQLKSHYDRVGPKIITRFPPEPNGYLHIGHAKAMRLSFLVAEAFEGDCLLRFDDTNPKTAHRTFAEMIKNSVEWLGYTPTKITYASDYFPQMFEFAKVLIRKDLAYICSQTPTEMSEYRKRKENSPDRNRPSEESLELFDKMQNDEGIEPGSLTLRLKIDQSHPNPTLRDPVAYRVPADASPHFRTGNTWRVYPTYDFAQCICDSLQDVTHSLCTLEFEIRRELYYWILDKLNIYKPYVWEFSRLNLSNTLVSKRHIKRLIAMKKEIDSKDKNEKAGTNQASEELRNFLAEKGVAGWDDPRLVTLAGMRRRGIPPSVLNEFVDHISFTRRGNENVTMREVLDGILRKRLSESSKRMMVVTDPIPAAILDSNEENLDKERLVFIEKSDVFWGLEREGPDEFYGVKEQGRICLKGWSMLPGNEDSSGVFICSIEKENNEPKKVFLMPEPPEKTKELGRPCGNLHWIDKNEAVSCEIRIYEDLLKNELPDLANLEEELNLGSLKIFSSALMPKKLEKGCLFFCGIYSKLFLGKTDLNFEETYQFERVGYFKIDEILSDFSEKRYVWTRIVGLVDKAKKKVLEKMENPLKENDNLKVGAK